MTRTSWQVWAAALMVGGCGSERTLTGPPPPPRPSLLSIAPTSAAPGAAGFTLTVNGTNLVSASTVYFGITALATTFVDSTRLTAAVPASAIATPGTVAVTVTNPAPSGGGATCAGHDDPQAALLGGARPARHVPRRAERRQHPHLARDTQLATGFHRRPQHGPVGVAPHHDAHARRLHPSA